MLSIPLPPIAKNSAIPYYYQISQRLVELIEARELRPGDRLPSIRQLCDVYGVSVSTAAQALEELVKAGHAVTKPARGTFVTFGGFPKESQVVTRFRRELMLTDLLREKGFEPEMQQLSVDVIEPSGWTRKILKLLRNQRVLNVRRLKFVFRDHPMMLAIADIPESLLPDYDRINFAQSLTKLLSHHSGIELEMNQEVFRPVLLDDVTADLLRTKPKELALCVDRISYDQRRQPVVFVRSLIRADLAHLYVTLTNARLQVGDADADGGELEESGSHENWLS